VEQIAKNMANNQLFGLLKKELDTWVVAEAIVAVTERLVHRYLLTGEKTTEELGKQVAQLFLNGILNHSHRGD
jgi:predicted transcriptional regulator